MPTLFTHAASAAAFKRLSFVEPMPSGFLTLSILCAMLPDADVAAFLMGIPYEHMLGHRGLSHSLTFAAAVGGICAAWVARGTERRVAPLWGYFFLVIASHGIFDAMTDGGLGVAFFAPFSDERYFLPWTPLKVSPIGGGFFTARGIPVAVSELVWVWLPLGVLSLVISRARG
ncbi:MAG: metal-dependent hydrolase [Elusimicrobia bacterium]|nr:metal-dependent hydrolase [Elusimicrobiota bacterium]